MKYIVTINNNSYEVEVDQKEAVIKKTAEVAAAPQAPVAAAPVAAAPAAPAPVAAAPAAPAPAAAVQAVEGEQVLSPMPGVILQVKKKAGEHVKKDDVIFILEAMKMENEIFSPKDGVIAQVVTGQGTSVNTGDLLAVIQ